MAQVDPHRTPPIAPQHPEQVSGGIDSFASSTTLPTSEEVAADPPEYDRAQMEAELEGLKATLEDLRGQLARAYDGASTLARNNSEVVIGAAVVGGVIAAGLMVKALGNRPSRRRRKFNAFQNDLERSAHLLADAITDRLSTASSFVGEEASRLGSVAQDKAEVFSDRAAHVAKDARHAAKDAARNSRHAAADGWDRLEQVIRPVIAAAVVDRAADWFKKVRS